MAATWYDARDMSRARSITTNDWTSPNRRFVLSWSQFKSPAVWLTLMRLVLTPFAVVTLLRGQLDMSFVLFAAAALSDVLDGWVARQLAKITALGAALDPIADKILLGSLLGTFACLGVLPLLPLFVVSAIQLVRWGTGLWFYRQTHHVIHAGIDGKITDWLFLGGIVCLYQRPEWALYLISAGIAAYIVSTSLVLRKAIKVLTSARSMLQPNIRVIVRDIGTSLDEQNS